MKTIKAVVNIEKGKAKVDYDKQVAESLADAFTLVAGENEEQKLAAVLKDFNYGNDLRVKSNLRREWEKKNEDPEKVIKKAADALVVAIPGMKYEEARAAVIAQRKAVDAEVPEA